MSRDNMEIEYNILEKLKHKIEEKINQYDKMSAYEKPFDKILGLNEALEEIKFEMEDIKEEIISQYVGE